MRAVIAVLFLALISFAQSLDSVVITDQEAYGAATDSLGNVLAIQAAGLSLPGGITPNIQSVFLLYRYTPEGKFIDRWEAHPLATTSRIVALRVDSKDRVYLAGIVNNATVSLQRLSDPAGTNWSNALSDVRLQITSMAFDPDDNPILLGTDNLGIRVIKVDRVSGSILAEGRFGGPLDLAAAIATDRGGGVYVTGITSFRGFPTTPGAFQTEWSSPLGARPMAFVTKLDASLKNFEYSTFFGGSVIYPNSIAVWTDGSAYIAGTVLALFPPDVPTTPGAFQTQIPPNRRPYFNGGIVTGPGAGFIARFKPDGSGLIASTFFTGNYSDGIRDIRVDADSNVTAIGGTATSDFPATGVWNTRCGPRDTGGIFVAKLDGLLTRLISSAILPQFNGNSVSELQADGSVYLPVFAAASVPGAQKGRIVRVNPNAPAPPVACIVNGASFNIESGTAPGELLTILGQDLGPAEWLAFDSAQDLPVSAGGTEVWIGGVPAPLLAVKDTQINAIVPFTVPLGASDVPVEVRRDGKTVFTWRIATVGQNPTPLFRFTPAGQLEPTDSGSPVAYQADIVNEDGTPNSRQNAAPRGSLVTLFATGLGKLTPDVRDGAPGAGDPARPVTGIPQVQTEFGFLLTPEDVTTIGGRTGAVLAVRFRIPSFPGSGGQFRFHLGPTVGQFLTTHFVYVR